MKINAVLGVAGVNAAESYKTKQIGRLFEFLVLIALLVMFARLLSFYNNDVVVYPDWITFAIWSVFFFELVVNLYNVKDKFRYVKENWLNLVIVIVAFPAIDWGSDWAVVIRSLRLLLFVRFFTGAFKDVIVVLKRNRFGQILAVFAFVILGAGGLFSYIEDKGLWDGVWYALVTITTVGYGDVVPVSDYGRIFGVVLILFGVVFFSLVTANISAFLIGSDQEKVEKDILQYMKSSEKRVAEQQALNDENFERMIAHMSSEIEQLRTEIKMMHEENISILKEQSTKKNKDNQES
ncbi:potassium channel family protein [Thiomicrorhabdus lithotrophica]|uniref:Potassium channel family protein n=1 Tax=Thiomicrorhabdus lithotrophica TaxID=2949997 RepID=A0ABY8C897_9GAMM|nr:potassium channel family protein [Thiomicrorhabdus lithotrophica]WEJ61767.1 potassium channel family protein [Thiomicrorhabdus lithotrophica]